MTDQQLNALKCTACQWVLVEHPYLHDNTKTDADWARWYDDVQEGKIDFDEPAIDEEGNETGYRAVYFAEDYEGWDEATLLYYVLSVMVAAVRILREEKSCLLCTTTTP